MDEIKQQFDMDLKQYNELKEQYKKWSDRFVAIPKKIEEAIIEISKEIDSFDQIYKELEPLCLKEDNKKIIEGRSKGIAIVYKMLLNANSSYALMYRNIIVQEIPELQAFESVMNKTEREVNEILNLNYDKIMTLKGNVDKVIKSYFGFINDKLLTIIDGIKTGSQPDTSLSEKGNQLFDAIIKTYNNLLCDMEEVLYKLDIIRIKANIGQKYDLYYHSAWEVEDTNIEKDDEKIFEVSRYGYMYKEKIYDLQKNHVVRPAQVILYKYKKQ